MVLCNMGGDMVASEGGMSWGFILICFAVAGILAWASGAFDK